ncbi:uncharacterized protein LOC5516120 isoform X2 [Nematostella vectensis]|uniref:uncharacterized protein LOC5516120 isoform X2 n=2 Tax=Nematostella vectensis TaxID=45351 RepID=UPI002076E890|nr:uncharacterized protein LOC5516120 isoform X2 [Nematostella vectensis]
MLGKSWGGFNALQVAALQPPALKAIISVYSSDDRYADDIHYLGGCVMGNSGLAWASIMALWNARPPDPLSVGKRWKEMWKHRLHHSSHPWMNTWLSHQTRDDYWKHASICEDFSQIKCPVLLIGGWADLYTNPVFRMAESLTCPLKAIVGPWSHCWPGHDVTPGPAIDHLEVFRQWFDCHLKGKTNGAMQQPNLRIYMKQGVKMPQNLSDVKDWPGEWICEEQWPSTNNVCHLYSLCQKSEKLVQTTSTQESRDPSQRTRSIQSDPACGINGGYNMASSSLDMPTDQSHDDGLSLRWDSCALEHDVSVLGFPEVEFELSSDQPQAQIAVRLCDVFPDGSSTLISRGILNLTHREGHGPESVKDLEPGKLYTIKVQLDATGYVVQQGNTLRLAVSPSYFPVVWPSPTPTTLNIHYGVLRLPVREASCESRKVDYSPLPLCDGVEDARVTVLTAGHSERAIEFDDESKLPKFTVIENSGQVYFHDTGTLREETSTEIHTMSRATSGRNPEPTITITKQLKLRKLKSPDSKNYQALLFDRKYIDGTDNANRINEQEFLEWNIRITHESKMWSDETDFYVRNKLECYHWNEHVFNQTWLKTVKRPCLK